VTKTVFALLLAAMPASVFAQDSAATNGAPQRSAAGAYTELQAVRGDSLFQMYCLSCHEPTFHSDEQFRFNWFGQTVYQLFKTLKTTMPEDNIGGLTDDEYTRVIAYILRLNGFAAGPDSLKADSLEMDRIVIGAAPADTAKRNRR
jgi:mono/diheme cytochrome c family protein